MGVVLHFHRPKRQRLTWRRLKAQARWYCWGRWCERYRRWLRSRKAAEIAAQQEAASRQRTAAIISSIGTEA